MVARFNKSAYFHDTTSHKDLAAMTALLNSAAQISDSADILRAIGQPHCNLAIWERPALGGLESLLRSHVEDVRFEAELVRLEVSLTRALDDAGYPAGMQRDALIADVQKLAGLYCDIQSLDRLHVRLEVVTTDSCRKFHADYVEARLITTYIGDGTQWLGDADAALVSNGKEPASIRSLGTGDVGIFKGKLATQSPAIHRSPPIAGTGQRRLLLVLNPPQEG